MNIIAGCARNVELIAPPGIGVRPTAGRSRKALFDSIGPRLQGAVVLDLFAGSGALGLEAVSRGAAALISVELNRQHINALEENILRIKNAGASAQITTINGSAVDLSRYRKITTGVSFIFADPPYAGSIQFFNQILCQNEFASHFAGAELFWEIPDTPGAAGGFVNPPHLTDWKIREFAGTRFLLGVIKP